MSRIYDLKGSERNRFNEAAAADPHDAKEVHLDDNLRRDVNRAPLLVRCGLCTCVYPLGGLKRHWCRHTRRCCANEDSLLLPSPAWSGQSLERMFLDGVLDVKMCVLCQV